MKQDRPLIEHQLARMLSGDQPPAIEYRIHRKDGQMRWISKMVVRYHDDHNRLVAYDSLIADITERKLTEITLRESEERFRLLFDDDLTGDYFPQEWQWHRIAEANPIVRSSHQNAGRLRLSGFALRGTGLSSRRYGLP